MSKHNSSIHSIETKGKGILFPFLFGHLIIDIHIKECTPSSQGVLKKQSLNENEIESDKF